MTYNLFKIRYLPSIYGTESSTALNNSNTVFIHTYLGDDSTGDGTRENPYRSLIKASLKGGVSYIVFRGVINEYVTGISKILIGDDINQNFITINFSPNVESYRQLTIDKIKSYNAYTSNPFCSIIAEELSDDESGFNVFSSKYNILYKNGSKFSVSPYNTQTINSTINGLSVSYFVSYYNCIITSYLNWLSTVYTPMVQLRNVIISTTTVLKYNYINLVQPLYGNNNITNINLAKNAFVSAGMTQIQADYFFYSDSFSNETCQFIDEYRSGGLSVNIFNQYTDNLTGYTTSSIVTNQVKNSVQLSVTNSSLYSTTGDIFIPNLSGDGYEVFTYTTVTINSGTLITFNGPSYTFKVDHLSGVTCTRFGDILDFTLNSDPSNKALWSSDVGGYVGCFRAVENSIINSGITIIDVDSGGTDTISIGDLILLDTSGNLTFNELSIQTWNRISDTNTTMIPNGTNFKGLNAMSQDGSSFGYYIGKKQNPIDDIIIYSGETLSGGTWYKVFNDISKDVTKSIIYNEIQYLPSYTFLCNSGVTGFTLLNSGTNSYVRKINSDILESIEILPYDNISTPSVHPKFSSPLMGDCKLIYYTVAGATRYGKTINTPVLFVDLSGTNFQTDFPNCSNKMSYYDNFAISNADQEFFTLSDPSLSAPKSTYFVTSIPILKYLRREINGHYDENYNY